MTISKYSNYIRIQSTILDQLLADPSGFDSIKVTGNINCCTQDCEQLISDFTIDLATQGWYADLTNGVLAEDSVAKLFIKNIVTNESNNVLSGNIDLGYVADNCMSESCTLEDFSGHFAPLFKTPIDNYFTSLGITSNVTISFDGNTLIVQDLPNGYFITDYIEHGVAEPFEKIIFTFSSTESNAFLAPDALYIKPEFFNNMSQLIDGIYRFDIKYTKVDNSGFITESNCAFIDITIKCKVASILGKIKGENANKSNVVEKCATIAHVLHYALVNGSNCGCNCADMCIVYRELVTLLSKDPSVTDCGC